MILTAKKFKKMKN